MRSQDAVFGLGNDVPFFSLVQEMVAQLVGIPMGALTVFVESLHVYERHWAKLQAFRTEYVAPMAIPKLSSALEVQMLLAGDDSDHAMSHPFTRWLYAA
jgi:thymidylate synthase